MREQSEGNPDDVEVIITFYPAPTQGPVQAPSSPPSYAPYGREETGREVPAREAWHGVREGGRDGGREGVKERSGPTSPLRDLVPTQAAYGPNDHRRHQPPPPFLQPASGERGMAESMRPPAQSYTAGFGPGAGGGVLGGGAGGGGGGKPVIQTSAMGRRPPAGDGGGRDLPPLAVQDPALAQVAPTTTLGADFFSM